MFEGLKAQLDRLLAQHGGNPDPRAYAAGLHDALVEAKAAVGVMREALAVTERELGNEQRQLADAERRGRLAADVPDAETVAVAERFAAKHRERIELLERKLGIQRDELRIAARDVEEMTAQLRLARQGVPPGRADARVEDELDAEQVRLHTDRMAYEAAVEAQLAHLKKKARGES